MNQIKSNLLTVKRKKSRTIPWLVVLMSLFFTNYNQAQVVINEILPGGTVELKNIGTTPVDVSGYWLCDFPAYQQISNSNLECGNTTMQPGEILAVDDFNVVDGADGEMGLYTTNAFGSPTALIDYVEWGSSGHQRASVAITAGIWTAGDFVPAFASTESLAYSGTGESSSSWTASANTTICQENTAVCDVDGGTLTGGPFAFDVGDGVADMIAPGSITLANNSGMNSQWVVTDEDGLILGLPPMPSVVNFDGAGSGTCLVWHLSYEDGIVGLAGGENANDLQGCFSLSNPISVVRTDVSNTTVGGTITGGPFEFCVGDGVADNVSGITLTGNSGTNSQWVVTDDQGNILGLPPMPSVVDFDVAGPGVCLIWHLSYEDDLMGLAAGENTANFTGTYSLSNSIAVTRNQPEGGMLTGGPFTFTVGDGVADMIAPGSITLANNSGSNSQWVVTDEDGLILGLPPMPSVVNFDGAGSGTCLVWHLSYEDGIVGLAGGENANDLQGCFSLSNPISVVRTDVSNTTVGGTITGGPFEFCVGDGVADNVSGITLTGNSGTNSQWVVTDDQGNILGLPPMPSVVDFDVAGPGVCLIWHLSYEDDLMGLAAGENTANFTGTYSLSNSIAVTRNQPEGGMLTGGPFTFTAGDGVADMIAPGSITLTNNSGMNSQWIVTDANGYILGLPPMPSVVDFDGAGYGNCLIWHLSYEDGLTGLAAGNNASDLEGCFSLSNSIEVIRNSVDGCNTNGGMLFGGPFEFTVGDGIADNITPGSITLANAGGQNSQWIVTDANGYILGLPPMPSVVDFDGAGYGNCLVWHLSYEDGLTGLGVGNNASELEGCFSLSNSIEVIRNSVDGCNTNGGTLFGGPFEFTVGDGVADMIAPGSITLANAGGQNSQWIVTDANGYILGLPPMPSVVDFDGAGYGNCLVWHLSYEDGLTGLAAGNNASELEGCFSLSNSIEVIRNAVDGCNMNGGMLFGGPFEFTVGDGVADMIAPGSITLANAGGQNSQWIVTDANGYILGLPPMPSVVDFDGAGYGNCLVWHLSYEDGLTGLGVGNNASDLEGCFSLSNSIEVIRNSVDGCNTNGGMLFGGPFEFTVGDGVADMIAPGSITLANAGGQNSQWIVTDANGYILGLPPMPSVVDFDGAGYGNCLVWHLSYEDGLTGLGVGNNASDLEGCFSLSNSIEVIRNSVDGCNTNGGMLFGGPFEFTVGDGVADMIAPGSITLANAGGQNSQWLVTEEDGTILGLPPMPSVVDFDGAGAGTCLVWHLSYEDGIEGLAAGANANDFVGCFSLSNPIAVVRNPVSNQGVDLDLDITVASSTYERYEEVDYTISITNDGTETATDVVISAGLPNGMVYTDDQVTQGDYDLYFEEWYVGDLAPGATAELDLTLFTLVEGVDIVNFVQVISAGGDDIDSTPDNNDTNIPQEDDEAAVTISEFGGTGEGNIDLEVSLSADQAAYDIYENVTYTVSVTNNGTDEATDITISAGLPNGMVYTGHSESAGDYNLFFETWTIPSLAAGETAELDLVLFTLVEDEAIVQFVEVLSANESDTDSTPGNGNGVSPQEDDEAAITVSPISSLVASAATRSQVSMTIADQELYPNPAIETINLAFDADVEAALSIRVFNITGQLQLDVPMNTFSGVNQVSLDISTLTPGTYYVQMVGATVNEQPLQFVKIN